MATLDQWAYNIRNLGRAGLGNSDDERLGIRQIKFWIAGYRAQGIFEYTNAGKDIDPQLMTDLGVLDLTEVDAADAPACQGIEWGCPIMKIQIPKLIDLPKNRALIFVGKIDKVTMFQKHEPNTHYFATTTRFANLISQFFIIGNTVYILLSEKDKGIKYINIRGVFEDPTTIKFKEGTDPDIACTERCFDDSIDDYPLPLRMYQYVTSNILQKELGLTLQTVEDLLNDAQMNRVIDEVPQNQ